LKALHVCLFAKLNNKRIIFVADQGLLVREQQQKLLNYFIGSQVNGSETKLNNKLPPLSKLYLSTWEKVLAEKNSLKKVKSSRRLAKKKNLLGNKANLNTTKTPFPGPSFCESKSLALAKPFQATLFSGAVSHRLRNPLQNAENTTSQKSEQFKNKKPKFWELILKANISKETSLDKQLSIGLNTEKAINKSLVSDLAKTVNFEPLAKSKDKRLKAKNQSEKKGITASPAGFAGFASFAFAKAKVAKAKVSVDSKKINPNIGRENPDNKSVENIKKNNYIHDPVFSTQITKLTGKAALRSSQWTATLARPDEWPLEFLNKEKEQKREWVGGFFSNSLASYKQSFSSANLLNIQRPLLLNQPLHKKSTNFDFRFRGPIELKEGCINLQKKEKFILSRLTEYCKDLDWNAVYNSPAPRKNSELNNLSFNSRFKQQLKNLRRPLKTGLLSNSFRLKKKKIHKKVIDHAIKSANFPGIKNIWLKEADLIFFANPEKSPSLLNQINRLKIPTIGITNPGSTLSRGTFKSVMGHSISPKKPIVNYPIVGNAYSLNFLRIILTKIASVLNYQRKKTIFSCAEFKENLAVEHTIVKPTPIKPIAVKRTN
jgi:hypothetical protein